MLRDDVQIRAHLHDRVGSFQRPKSASAAADAASLSDAFDKDGWVRGGVNTGTSVGSPKGSPLTRSA